MGTPYSQRSGGCSGRGDVVDIDLVEMFSGLATEDTGEGLTTREISERVGCSVRAAVELVRKAIQAGKCRPSRKMSTDIAGRRLRVPSYVFEK